MKCRTKFCRGHTTAAGHSPYCRTRRFREFHFLKYCFHNLKKRARHRGKVFTLTFEEYEEFARKTGYDKPENRGKKGTSLTIHRRENHRGYERDNIECVTLSQNSRLQFAPIPQWLKDDILAGGGGRKQSQLTLSQ